MHSFNSFCYFVNRGEIEPEMSELKEP